LISRHRFLALSLALLLGTAAGGSGQIIQQFRPRGSSDPADWTNLKVGLDKDVGVSTDGDGVYDWTNSGSLADFTQSTGAKKPAAGVTSDGTDDELLSTSTMQDLWDGTALTGVAVASRNTGNTSSDYLFGAGSNDQAALKVQGSGIAFGFDSATLAVGTMTNDVLYAFAFQYDGTKARFKLRGGSWGEDIKTPAAPSVHVLELFTGAGARWGPGTIQDLYITDDVKSDADIDAALDFLATKRSL